MNDYRHQHIIDGKAIMKIAAWLALLVSAGHAGTTHQGGGDTSQKKDAANPGAKATIHGH